MKLFLYILVGLTLVSGGIFFMRDAKVDPAASEIPREDPIIKEESVSTSSQVASVASVKSAIAVKPEVSLIKELPPLKGDAKALYPVAPSAGGEWTPDLYAEATKELVTDARWSEIIKANVVSSTDILRIPDGVTLTYDGVDSKQVGAIVIKGALVFDPSISTKMTVGTIFVLNGGKLSIEPEASWTAEIVFKGAVSRDQDPAELLLGLVAVGGEVKITGRSIPVSFTEVKGNKGGVIITTSAATSWRTGDEVILSASGPSTADPSYWWFNARDVSKRMPFPEEWEKAKIRSIDGTSITLDRVLSYDHSGYVANLSRSVVIRSEAANPLKSRGHVMFAGNVSVSVRNARFKDLGRTTVSLVDNTSFSGADSIAHYGSNEEGRYALHLHHAFSPFIVSGNVVDGSEFIRSFPGGSGERAIYGSPKWGIVNHDSPGTISQNIVIGAAGSGIVGEDGPETGVVEKNLVMGTGGGSGDNDDERFGVTKGEDMGHGGFGFWFRGPFLNVRDNVAVGHFNQGAYLYFVHPDFSPNRLSSQVWIPQDLRGKTKTDLLSLEPIREFSGNKASGFFGSAAFIAFYFQAPIEIHSSYFEALGKGSTGGVLLRHSKSMKISDSTFIGNGEGEALVSSPETGQITTSNSTVTGFSK